MIAMPLIPFYPYLCKDVEKVLTDELKSSDGKELDYRELRELTSYFDKTVHLRYGMEKTIVGGDATYRIRFYIDSYVPDTGRVRLDISRTIKEQTAEKKVILPADELLRFGSHAEIRMVEFDDNKKILLTLYNVDVPLASLFSDLFKTADLELSEVWDENG